MKRVLLTTAFMGLITVIGNAQTKKEKAPPLPPPPVSVILVEEVPPPPPPIALPSEVKTKHQLRPQEDNVSVPPAPPASPVPERSKAIKKRN